MAEAGTYRGKPPQGKAQGAKGFVSRTPSWFAHEEGVCRVGPAVFGKRRSHARGGGLHMLTNTLKYKDYFAEFGYDESADALHGRVIGINDVIDFYGHTIDELKAEFRTGVDEYVEWCLSEGEEPEKTWSGKMTLRPSDEQRRQYFVAAAARKKSVSAWMLEVLDRESAAVVSTIPHIQ
jgi:predicted HicB family RNase H-like nuclease